MNNYNNNYIQKRNAEKNSKMMGKDIAEAEHYKEIKKVISECANIIAKKYRFSQNTCERIISLIYEDKGAVTELPLRINYVVNILEKYGYSSEQAIDVIDSNFSLIKQKPLSLLHNLAIASQYGFDEELLINNAKYSNINEKELYALIEQLKENGSNVTLENVLELNVKFRNNRKMSNLIEKHQLEKRKLYVYLTLYERNMNCDINKDIILTK